MKHNIHPIKRLEQTNEAYNKRSKNAYAIWLIDIDGIQLKVNYFVSIGGHAGAIRARLVFPDYPVTKHPDYKEIRNEVLRKIRERYHKGPQVDLEILPPHNMGC